MTKVGSRLTWAQRGAVGCAKCRLSGCGACYNGTVVQKGTPRRTKNTMESTDSTVVVSPSCAVPQKSPLLQRSGSTAIKTRKSQSGNRRATLRDRKAINGAVLPSNKKLVIDGKMKPTKCCTRTPLPAKKFSSSRLQSPRETGSLIIGKAATIVKKKTSHDELKLVTPTIVIKSVTGSVPRSLRPRQTDTLLSTREQVAASNKITPAKKKIKLAAPKITNKRSKMIVQRFPGPPTTVSSITGTVAAAVAVAAKKTKAPYSKSRSMVITPAGKERKILWRDRGSTGCPKCRWKGCKECYQGDKLAPKKSTSESLPAAVSPNGSTRLTSGQKGVAPTKPKSELHTLASGRRRPKKDNFTPVVSPNGSTRLNGVAPTKPKSELHTLAGGRRWPKKDNFTPVVSPNSTGLNSGQKRVAPTKPKSELQTLASGRRGPKSDKFTNKRRQPKTGKLHVKKAAITRNRDYALNGFLNPLKRKRVSQSPFDGWRSTDITMADKLLRKARQRLLNEIKKESAITGERVRSMLPHALPMFARHYNKNGRIGIYSPSERAAFLARYKRKKSQRVWLKGGRSAARGLRKGPFVAAAAAVAQSSNAHIPLNGMPRECTLGAPYAIIDAASILASLDSSILPL